MHLTIRSRRGAAQPGPPAGAFLGAGPRNTTRAMSTLSATQSDRIEGRARPSSSSDGARLRGARRRRAAVRAEEEPLVLHPCGLSRGELRVAGIERVVHVVVDRVEPRLLAAVLTLRAAGRRDQLGRRVV